MGNVLIKCTAKPDIVRRMGIISSMVLIPLSLVLLFINLYASLILVLSYAATLYTIQNIESFDVTEDGIYVCRRNGSVIYGYRYSEIERVEMVQAGKYKGLLLLSDRFKGSNSLTLWDKTRITVPEYVNNYDRFLDWIEAKLQDKLSNEAREYIKAQRTLPSPF